MHTTVMLFLVIAVDAEDAHASFAPGPAAIEPANGPLHLLLFALFP